MPINFPNLFSLLQHFLINYRDKAFVFLHFNICNSPILTLRKARAPDFFRINRCRSVPYAKHIVPLIIFLQQHIVLSISAKQGRLTGVFDFR